MDSLDLDRIKESFRQDGFVFLPSLLPCGLQEDLLKNLPDILAEDGPHRFFENDGSTVRAIYGLHRKPAPWRTISENSVITRIAHFLLGEQMYVFQWKINPKAARAGDHWEWHRDFTFWHREDGMPTSNAVTAALFLDPVTEDSGPLEVIPGSYSASTSYELPEELQRNDYPYRSDNTGHSDSTGHSHSTGSNDSGRADGNWSALVSANLSHSLPDDAVRELAEKYGTYRATGEAGSVVFFHSNAVHGSMPNRSGQPRTLGFITYNAVTNAPHNWPRPRPDFFVNHDSTALLMPRLEASPKKV